MRTAIANNACKSHKDRLNDGVTIYFIVANHVEAVEFGPVFAAGALRTAYIVSVTHRTACRASCV